MYWNFQKHILLLNMNKMYHIIIFFKGKKIKIIIRNINFFFSKTFYGNNLLLYKNNISKIVKTFQENKCKCLHSDEFLPSHI